MYIGSTHISKSTTRRLRESSGTSEWVKTIESILGRATRSWGGITHVVGTVAALDHSVGNVHLECVDCCWWNVDFNLKSYIKSYFNYSDKADLVVGCALNIDWPFAVLADERESRCWDTDVIVFISARCLTWTSILTRIGRITNVTAWLNTSLIVQNMVTMVVTLSVIGVMVGIGPQLKSSKKSFMIPINWFML